MNDAVYASQAQLLIWIVLALIPLVIWVFRDAEQIFVARRSRRRLRR